MNNDDFLYENKYSIHRASDIIGNIHPNQWLINDIIPENSSGALFSASGVGKTIFAIDMCAHIATGKSWHGHKVKQGSVIYIKGEGHNGFGKRLSAWQTHHNVNLDNYDFYASETASNFCDIERVNEVIKAVNEIIIDTNSTPSFVVIDTLARNFQGDENSARDMGLFINNIENNIRSLYQCSVLIIHHTGHSDSSRGRGSSSLHAALEFEFKLNTQGDRAVQFICSKMKDDEKPSPQAFNMIKVELDVFNEDGSPLSSLVIEPTNVIHKSKKTSGARQTKMLEVLKDLRHRHKQTLTDTNNNPDSARVTLIDWRMECIERGVLKEKNSRQNVNTVKNALTEKGVIEMDGTFVNIL